MHPYTLLYNDRPVVGDPISDWFCAVEREVLGLILVTHHGVGDCVAEIKYSDKLKVARVSFDSQSESTALHGGERRGSRRERRWQKHEAGRSHRSSSQESDS